MSGIRTNAAAELLGVSPNTLRSWERRFGYPKPRRTAGGHRQYDLAELEALRRALLETHNISSAIEVARQRGEGPSSRQPPAGGLRPLRRGARRPRDGGEPRRALGRAHASRSCCCPRSSWPSDREGREAECEFACRWATGWLHAARRVAPPATPLRRASCCSTRARASTSSRCTCRRSSWRLRRAGFRMLLLAMTSRRSASSRAMRALDPDRARGLRQRRHARRGRPARLHGAPDRLRRARVRVPRGDAGHRQPRHPVARLRARPRPLANMKAIVDGRGLEVAEELASSELVPAPPARAHGRRP